jgi:predicted  nucleic acid-binding Zn-ribbon protein
MAQYKFIVKRENMLADMLEKIQKTSDEMELRINAQILQNNRKIEELTKKTNDDLLSLYCRMNEKSQVSKDHMYKKFLNISQIVG